MVNTGKPSRGCYKCRARRIKCDEAKPSCKRCQKSKRICPGYRDLLDLKLRDESKSTKRELSSGHHRHRSMTPADFDNVYCGPYDNAGTFVSTTAVPPFWQRVDWTVDDNYHWSERSTSPPTTRAFDTLQAQTPRTMTSPNSMTMHKPGLIQPPLSTPMDQQAICFFLSNYILSPGSESLTSRGHLHFLVPLLQTQPADSPLVHTFTSVGLATMAVRPESRALLPMATSMYVKSLRQINSLLRDPSTMTSDTTLATILLVTTFEQVVSSRTDAWSSHVHGAVAIVKARGKESFQSKMGKDIFLAVREVVTIHYIAQIFRDGPSLEWWLNDDDDAGDRSWAEAYAAFNLRVADLHQESDKTIALFPRTPKNITSVLSFLHKAQNLEREYREWIEATPAIFKPEPMAWVDWADICLLPGSDLSNSIAHPGRIDSYRELGIAYAYNVVRSSQILTWTIILRCVAWLGVPEYDYRLTSEYKQASQICTLLIADIVSSVPYSFGWNAKTDPTAATKAPQDMKGVAGVFLMFPLWVACRSDFASESQREYLKGRLDFIGNDMGICQARILSNADLRHPSLYILIQAMKMKTETPNPKLRMSSY